jgi:hypothetical protein
MVGTQGGRIQRDFSAVPQIAEIRGAEDSGNGTGAPSPASLAFSIAVAMLQAQVLEVYKHRV